MSYKHGVGIQEVPTKLPLAVQNLGGVPIVFGTAPIHLTEKPLVNEIVLCKTFDEAKEKLGYSEDYESFSLCEVMDVFFKYVRVAPVVFCNVLDLKVHNTDYSEQITVVNKQLKTTQKGVIKEGLTVGSLNENDYVASYDEDGFLILTLVGAGMGTSGSVQVSGKRVDVSKVVESHLVGSYDSETGKSTGLELLKEVYPKFGVLPGLLLAPGFSHEPTVGVALAEKCKNISGVFSCECVVDIDTDRAKKLSDVEKVKRECGFSDSRMIVTYPMVKVGGKKVHSSGAYAAMAMKVDAEYGFTPSRTASNKNADFIEGILLKDGTEFYFDLEIANSLNAIGVVTALNFNGYRFWGNNTSAYPEVIDPRERWINNRRFFSWWGNSFVLEYFKNVDDLTNKKMIESIIDRENIRGNSFVADGHCAGFRIEFSGEDNPQEALMSGRISFRLFLAPFIPSEYIEAVMEFDVNMIKSSLGGGK